MSDHVGVAPMPTARRRVLVAFAIGLLSGGALLAVGPWQLAVLIGFDVWAMVQIVWVGVKVLGLDGDTTRAVAQVEDDSRAQASIAVNLAGVASLVGVGFALSKARHVGPVQGPLLTISALVTVVLAWLTVQTVFTLRYAHLYYGGTRADGGIDFEPADELPDYRDFAYFGFTVGMTYQVSDTAVTNRMIRRTVTRQALISFLFATAIIGLTINVMAGFVQ